LFYKGLIMASLVLSGDTSGSITVSAPAVAGSTTQTLVNVTGTLAPLVSGTAIVSSGANIDFTGIPSWAKRVTIMFNGISTTGTSPPQIQVGSGSFTTSGYLGANSVIAASSVATVVFTTGFGIGVNTGGWSAASVISGTITLTLMTGNTWTASGSAGSSVGTGVYLTAGGIALSGALDRVRITTVNGTDTFDAGTFNIMWE
jgi:hypothetical protein